MSETLNAFKIQLTAGCCSLHCSTKECCSCSDFCFKGLSSQQLDDKARELSLSGAHPCPFLPPYLYDIQSLSNLFNFSEQMNKFIKGGVLTISDRQEIQSVFSDKNLFACTFLKDTSLPITSTDLNFDKDFCQNVFSLFTNPPKQYDQFIKSIPFSQTVLAFTSDPTPSVLTIRGIFLLFLYLYLWKFTDISILVEMIKTIITFDPPMATLFQDMLHRNPYFIPIILTTLQDSLTILSLDPSSHPHLSILHALAIFIDILAKININLDQPYPVSSFYNEALSALINPRFEYNMFQCHPTWNTYLQFPAALTLPIKKGLLHEEYQQMKLDIDCTLTVRRNFIVDDTLSELNRVRIETENTAARRSRREGDLLIEPLRGSLKIVFQGEPGVDDGGLSREFVYLLIQKLFSHDYGLFEKGPTYYWFMNLPADRNTSMLIGRIIGMALFNGFILPIKFPIFLYKKLLGRPLKLIDIQELDPEIYATFNHLLTASAEEFENSYLTFTCNQKVLDVIQTIPLCPGGENRDVTPENFQEFISLYIDYKFNKSVQHSFEPFKEGFLSVAGTNSLQILEPEELSLLISGEDIIDWDKIRRNANYEGYTPNSETIKIFWRAIKALDLPQQKLFLKFLLGIDKVPFAMDLKIGRSGDLDKLPTAHTCANTLILPDYQDERMIRRAIQFCIENCEGFGFI